MTAKADTGAATGATSGAKARSRGAKAKAATAGSHAFEADVAKLLHLMVHSVYSDRDVFLRELISNAADACEKLRYEALQAPDLLGDDPKPRIVLTLDKEAGRLSVADNGIGMSDEEMVEALGTIARSGTKAFVERIDASAGAAVAGEAEAAGADEAEADEAEGGDEAEADEAEGGDAEPSADGSTLIGQFGVGFYSSFMVADRVEVVSRRAGAATAHRWSSDGKGRFSIEPAAAEEAPARGTVVTLHLMADARTYAERATVERIVKAQSGHVPVPILLADAPGAEPVEIADGAALWTKPKSAISADDYADFYRSLAGQFDKPALTVHVKAEGRHDYTLLAFVPGSRPLDLFDPLRKGRMKLYVRRVLITDEAEILPGYLRFVRGLVDSADLPLNVSREMIQESPLLAQIRKAVTTRILTELDKLAASDAGAYETVWEAFGSVLKEGLYEDFERRDALFSLARFKTTTSAGAWRSLKDIVASAKENQTAIYYLTGDDLERLAASPQLEGFRARGVEVLLLTDPVDAFWVTSALGYEGKPFKSVTQGAADLALIPLTEQAPAQTAETSSDVAGFIAFAKGVLGEAVADVRASDRLTESAVCLVAPEFGPDRRLEKILAGAGRLDERSKPVLEVNPRHALVERLAAVRAKGGDLAPVEDATRLLLDEARILDGEVPSDAKGFAERLSRLMASAIGG